MAELMSKAEWQELGIEPKPSEVRGAPAFCDPERDLYYHEGVPGDSCFVVGHVTGGDGNIYDFLVHSGALKLGEGEGVGVSMVSITDKAGKRYCHTEANHPWSSCTFATDRFEIATPTSRLAGSSRAFDLYGELPDGQGHVSARIVNEGPALMNGGMGLFPCMDGEVWFMHFGLPHLKAEGELELDGRRVAFAGDAWLDRQWGIQGNLALSMGTHNVQTKWMDLNLSNGYKVSLWDIAGEGIPKNSFATVLAPDGTTTVAAMRPLVENEDLYWESPVTGNLYATSYVVEIPAFGARIDVKVYDGIPDQEAVSSAGYNRYEAHSDCEGEFLGEQVTGFCCIELVGDFARPKQEIEPAGDAAATFDPKLTGTYRGIMHSPMGDQVMTFDYLVEGEALTGSINVMKRTSPITEARALPGGFTHKFKLKVPIGSVEATITAKLVGDALEGTLKTPVGELAFTADRV